MYNFLPIFKHIIDISGGSILFYLGAYTYLTDITTEENRTSRLAIFDGLMWIGFQTGSMLSGPIKTNFGLKYNFIIGLILSVISFLYTWIFIKESRHTETSEPGNNLNDHNLTTNCYFIY
jgi:PCFT/HCP family folate transporter-like MFS transporter 1/3